MDQLTELRPPEFYGCDKMVDRFQTNHYWCALGGGVIALSASLKSRQ